MCGVDLASPGTFNQEIARVNTKPYLDASLVETPGIVNQKQPAGDQYDIQKDNRVFEAHCIHFDGPDDSDSGVLACQNSA
jgi:hypothetical protein